MNYCKICDELIDEGKICHDCAEKSPKCPNCGHNSMTEINWRETCVLCDVSYPQNVFSSDVPVWDKKNNDFCFYDKLKKKMFTDMDFTFDGKYLIFYDDLEQYRFRFNFEKRV